MSAMDNEQQAEDTVQRATQTELDSISVFDKPVWTDTEFALAMGIERVTVANRISKGKPMPPYTYVGGSRRWLRDSVLSHLSANQVRQD